MAKVLFKRYETNQEAEESQIIDGQFIVTKEGKTFVDYGTDRIAVGGTLDTQMSDTSINGVENKVIKSYVDDNIDDVSGDISNLEQNLENNYQPKITSGTSDPSGGSDGDIYFKYS